MRDRLLRLLGHRRTYIALIAINVLVSGAGILHTVLTGTVASDHYSYLALANGILHGHYSMHYQLAADIPDTFRTPGFPLYLAVIMTVFRSWRAIVLVQTALLVFSVHLTFRTMARFGFGLAARSVFLLLLLSSQNVIACVPVVTPEIPAIACLALLTFGDPLYRRPSLWTGIGLGALAGFLFQCKPVFLLLPFVRFALDLLVYREQWKPRVVGLYAATYIATLLPFALWNKAHHGVFQPTPLEGGGGVFQIGWWAGRMPGYHQHRYWDNFTADEIVRFVPEDSVAANIAGYEHEWDVIDSTIAPLLTATDTLMLAHYADQLAEKTFNTRYTLAREALLKQRTFQHMREQPGYTLRYKLYSAIRLWVVGIDRSDFQAAGPVGKLKLAIPCLITLAQFLLGFICIPLALFKGRLLLRETHPLVLPVVYGWVLSIPFVIQTRYTVPLRLLFFALAAMALIALLERKKHTLQAPSSNAA